MSFKFKFFSQEKNELII